VSYPWDVDSRVFLCWILSDFRFASFFSRMDMTDLCASFAVYIALGSSGFVVLYLLVGIVVSHFFLYRCRPSDQDLYDTEQ